ncbi:MAG: Endo-1,4-beta-xylanase Z precursor [Firmicutes bacterium ADurb.Bin193]|nr:MAG: Endo-1,4-beta-xylanase Z precursor [Firmicutes bacterium ADurb.Bin193]
MALLKINYKSQILNKATGINAILPDKREPNTPLPVLYLLHGYSDNENAWCAQTSIERYVRFRNIAVVMPDGFRSFYTDMVCGAYDCYSYILNELIPFCTESFNLSPDRSDTYIAGLSMGGYGAFKFALSAPEKFSAAASFSGTVDIARLASEYDMSAVFSYPLENSENDLFYLAKKASKAEQKPRLYQWCGTDDFLYEDNIRFRDYIKNLGFDYTYKEGSGGHEWKRWDDQIKKIFSWLGIQNRQ